MSDYLSNLTAKSLDQVPVLQPRLASRFEPLALTHQDFPDGRAQAMPEPEQQFAVTSPFSDATNPVPEVTLGTPQQSSVLSHQTGAGWSELEADAIVIPPVGDRATIAPEPVAASNPKTGAIVPKTQAERQFAEDIQDSSLEKVRNRETLDLFPSPQQKIVESMEQNSPSVSDRTVPSPIFVEVAPAQSVAQNSARRIQPALARSSEISTRTSEGIAQVTEDGTNTFLQTITPPAPREAEPTWRGQLTHPVVAAPRGVSAAEQNFDSATVSLKGNRDLAPASIQIPRLVTPAIAIAPAQSPAQFSEFATAEPPPTPTIQVTIGRIEVRATPPPSTPSKPRSTPAVMGLNDYLRQRAKGANG